MSHGEHVSPSSRHTMRSQASRKASGAGKHVDLATGGSSLSVTSHRPKPGRHLAPAVPIDTTPAHAPSFAVRHDLDLALLEKLNSAPVTRKDLRLMEQKSARRGQFMVASAATMLMGTIGTVYASAANQTLAAHGSSSSQVVESQSLGSSSVSRHEDRQSQPSATETASVTEDSSARWNLDTNSSNVDTAKLSVSTQKAKVESVVKPSTSALVASQADSASKPTTLFSYTAPAAETMKVNHATGDSGNAYEFSQCTWWAYLRRHQLGLPVGSHFGNGGQWAASARGMGYAVDNKPQVGDVMVFAPGQEGSDPSYGHVAIVESVNPDGTVTISECGAVWQGVIHIRTISNPSNFQFIHS